MRTYGLLFVSLMGVLAMSSTLAAQASRPVVDFETNVTSTGQRFGTYSDRMMKGSSKIVLSSILGTQGSGHAVEVTGTITNDYPYGFAGLHLPLAKSDADTIDASQSTGVRFSSRGDGQSYFLVLVTKGIKDFDYLTYTFKPGAEWQEYVVPFSKFKQLGFGAPAKWTGKDLQAVRFQIQTFGPPIEQFKFDVDNIELY